MALCLEVGSALRADLVTSIQSTQRETGNRNVTCGPDSFSGLRSRPSGPGYRYSAPGTGSGPAPVPEPDNPYLIPDQPRPETRRCYLPATRHPRPPPATRGRHPLPETVSSPYTQYSKLNTLVHHLCTFAQELRSDLHLCTIYLRPSCPRNNVARYFAYASLAAF